MISCKRVKSTVGHPFLLQLKGRALIHNVRHNVFTIGEYARLAFGIATAKVIGRLGRFSSYRTYECIAYFWATRIEDQEVNGSGIKTNWIHESLQLAKEKASLLG